MIEETAQALEDAVALEEAELLETEAEELDIDFEIEEKSNRVSEAISVAKDNIQEKYDIAKSACKGMIDRLTYDLEQTDYNPYIRSTTTHKIEILRSAEDTEPVDVFEFEKTAGFSLRAMAITAAVVAVADIAVAKLLKKKSL
jgi:stage III sporulation protein SpoIIIAA